MATSAKHQVTILGADKTQITALAIEFWTSRGFVLHNSSYNCIVLRRGGFGSIGNLLGRVVSELFDDDKGRPWDEAPMELRVLCQVPPEKATCELDFKLAFGCDEMNPGDFSRASRSWCDAVSLFCRQWMGQGGE
jgi:hypothetical protein